ncbi:MAG: hypothetical protein LBM99_05735, partial [Bacillales bacterium]|nr:hypothetical protein [Bacillales bacterium]
MQHILQREKNECGIAVMIMYLSLFKIEKSYEEIKESIDINEKGLSLLEMSKYLNNYTQVNSFQLTETSEITVFPCIAIISHKKKNHFILIYKKEGNDIIYSDPCHYALKKRKLTSLNITYLIFGDSLEVVLPSKKKQKDSLYAVPLIILQIVELFLITFSFFYLFSMVGFSGDKILTFLIVILISLLITLLKNYCLNKVNIYYDKELIFNRYTEIAKKDVSFVSELFKIKNFIISKYTLLIPSLIIILIGVAGLLFINPYIYLILFG